LSMKTRIGIGGCRKGWVAAILGSQGTPTFSVHQSLANLLNSLDPESTVVVIDAAIGLPDRGERSCDEQARELLNTPRADSVFPAPCRPVLRCPTYDEANRANRKLKGCEITLQGFAQFPRIREADEWITPERQQWVREGHPEVIFARLSPEEQGILFSKKSATGERLRLDLLRRFGFKLDIVAVREEIRPKNVSRDEIVDAAACLVIAHLTIRDDILVLPEGEVQLDSRGLRMEIVT
jgi:predicted RNase H-like nuclease